MKRKNSYLTITDQFCGAGGSSHGARNVIRKMGGGMEIKLALNHWKLAIETHNTNFPDTIHDCTDISASDPRRYLSTNILITSPECTNHSLAKGKKQLKAQMQLFEKGIMDPSAERSRATMWDVPRFAEYHDYEVIIVENVVDARKWVMWDAWLKAMHSLGYDHKSVYLNSMHCHPTPQSRDRIYVVFWKKGNKAPDLDYKPLAFCHKCERQINAFQSWKNPQKKWGKYKQQYDYRCPTCGTIVEPYYYAAFNIIDWSIPGKPVIGRERPLSENTIRRIEYGLKKYGNEYMIIGHRYSGNFGVNIKSQGDPLPVQTSTNVHGIVSPLIITTRYTSGINCRVKSATKDVLPTQPGDSSHALVMPYIISGEHVNCSPNSYTKSCKDPLHTQTTRQAAGVVMPFIVENHGTGKARSSKDPVSTILAGGNHHGIVQAPIVVENNGKSKARSGKATFPCITTSTKHGFINPEALQSFLTYYNGCDQASHITDPSDTITTVDRVALVNHKQPRLEDCTYRTIKPHEVQAAMAFDRDYIILGNSRNKVKQLGNAVTPPVMEWLIEQCVRTLK
jgi:DNA (cytosine-5)-methyltransferase 1